MNIYQSTSNDLDIVLEIERLAFGSDEEAQLVRNLLDRAFDGSAKSLVMHALSGTKSSAEELAEIRELLDSLEGDQK